MVNIIKQTNNTTTYVTDFIADTEDDVQSLPTKANDVAPGSTCLVAETGNVYILNNQEEWKKL